MGETSGMYLGEREIITPSGVRPSLVRLREVLEAAVVRMTVRLRDDPGHQL
jgi:hypothetical protein